MKKTSDKTLLIISGSSGSGKSTLAETIQIQSGCIVCTADDYFMEDGEYKFDFRKLGEAHNQCQVKCFSSMAKSEPLIVIANTTTTRKEAQPYLNAAKVYGYQVHWVFMGHHHKGENQHGVPEEVVQKQKERVLNTFTNLTRE